MLFTRPRPFSWRSLVAALALASVPIHAETSWIWADGPDSKSAANLRKSFEVAGPLKEAVLVITCDNGAKVFLDGELVVTNPDWSEPSKVNLTRKLKAGRHELRAECKNEGDVAGFVARLTLKDNDGKQTVIESDGTWEASLPGKSDWKPAKVLAKYGGQPWGDALAGAAAPGKPAAPPVITPDSIQVLPGFRAELIYAVPKSQQGSWVSMTVDPQGRLVACDQGGGLYRLTLAAPGSSAPATIEKLKNAVGGAHGLLHAFGSLYVMVNEQGGRQGLWRLRDTDGDDQYDEEKMLRRIDGGGEHGPHGIVLSPDGKSLYVACGNHTKLPEHMELSRAARAWDEDQVVTRLWDANGHARGILAPGGYICKTDPDGKSFELISYGYRNEYDIAFNAVGDLFTYDSDMEWDAGAPWYRPTRVSMATSGSDMGWRSGAGKWPTYYPDSLPALVDIGPGSPTGVTSGQGAKFPARYQNAIFANDWTYGTMYAIHLTPDGAGYKAEKEEFVSGRPLPLTDVVIHPKDGAMYFAIGGRGTESAVYRVTYVGKQSTAPAPAPKLTAAAKLRRELEQLHLEGTGSEAVSKAWKSLGHEDRFVRYAARVAIERRPVSEWADRVLTETRPWASIEGAVALARMGKPEHRDRLLAFLNKLDLSKLDEPAKLAVVRAYQLTLIRQGNPEGDAYQATHKRLDALYPSGSRSLNRELVGALVRLGSPTVVAKSVPLMLTANDADLRYASDALLDRNRGYAGAFAQAAASRPNQEQIAYAYLLREAKVGWTPALRKSFFSWFPRTAPWQGGNSFRGFIENIRKDALSTVADASERKSYEELSTRRASGGDPTYAAPKGPGKSYTVEQALALASGGVKGRSYETGKAMYNSVGCAACHRFDGAGGGVGPDLSGVASRYTLRDLMENIIEPSKVISDQYGSEEVQLADGSSLVGRAYVENGKLVVTADPRNPEEFTAVALDQVKSRKPYPVSLMPAGMINPLNQDELLDLIAYLQSGGNPKHKAFAK
jgi:putative heme-binding domain-containing protein